MKIIWLFLFIATNSYAVNLQQVISKYKIVETVPELESSVSFIENVAIRAGQQQDQTTDNIDQDIELRLSLNGLKEQRQKTKLHKNQQKRLEANRLEASNQELELIYKIYLKLHFGIHERDKLNKLLTISKDRVKVMDVYVKKNKAYITDLVKVEQKINQVRKDLLVKNTELNKTLDLLNRLLKTNYKLSDISLSEELANVGKIEKSIKNFTSSNVKENLELEKANLEYQIEVGENAKVFDFIQVDYNRNNAISNNGDEVDNRIGVTLAINLPFLRDKTKVNEKFIQKLKAEYTAKYEAKASIEAIDEIKVRILRYTQSLRQLVSSSYLTKAEKYLKIYSRSKGIEPLKLLELNNMLIEGQIEKIQLQYMMYDAYVSFLKESGALAKYSTDNVLALRFKGEV